MIKEKFSKYEMVPPDEFRDRLEVAELTVKLQEKRRSVPSNKGELLRGVHPKSHGCVDAEFAVHRRLPRHLRVGLFREPGRVFHARIRFSNADVLILPDVIDGENRSRGMAIKVLDAGNRAIVPDRGAVNQDFLLINTAEFAFANVRDYLRLTRALMQDEHGANPDLFFLPLKLAELGVLNPATGALVPPTGDEPPELAGLRQAFQHSGVFEDFGPVDFANTLQSFQVVQKIQSETVRNPVDVAYFSASVLRFGRNRVMRVSVVPLDAPEQTPFSAEELNGLDPDFLANALEAKLRRGDVKFSVRLQIAHADQIADHIPDMIENASKSWDETEFPPVEVARIRIPKLEAPGSPVDACKGQFFTPWHSLPAHRPLGGINRLRRGVYNQSAATRLQTVLRTLRMPN